MLFIGSEGRENRLMRREVETYESPKWNFCTWKIPYLKWISTADKINRWFDITEQERLVIFEEIVIETNQNETEKKLKNQ